MVNEKLIAPKTPPKKRAGEKVPPKKPKPIHMLVRINFPTKRLKDNYMFCSEYYYDIKVSVPSPKISLKNIQLNRKQDPAIRGACQFLIFFEG